MARTKKEALEIGEKVLKSMSTKNPLRLSVCEIVEYIESTQNLKTGRQSDEDAVTRLTKELTEVTKQRDVLKMHLDRIGHYDEFSDEPTLVDEHS